MERNLTFSPLHFDSVIFFQHPFSWHVSLVLLEREKWKKSPVKTWKAGMVQNTEQDYFAGAFLSSLSRVIILVQCFLYFNWEAVSLMEHLKPFSELKTNTPFF